MMLFERIFCFSIFNAYFCQLKIRKMTVIAEEKIYTVEEYFELEKHSEIRHEFVNGKLIPMPGESVIANLIADNCGYNLRTQLSKKGYVIIRHDVRAIIQTRKIYRYPDVSVAKLSEITETHAITKPEMLIEVTSENSSKIDHDDKLKQYTTLPSLQYYMIISQEEMLVELYSRDEKGWRFEIFFNPLDKIELPYFKGHLQLVDIYENVQFAESKSDE